jgi:hypothetical protein
MEARSMSYYGAADDSVEEGVEPTEAETDDVGDGVKSDRAEGGSVG